MKKKTPLSTCLMMIFIIILLLVAGTYMIGVVEMMRAQYGYCGGVGAALGSVCALLTFMYIVVRSLKDRH